MIKKFMFVISFVLVLCLCGKAAAWEDINDFEYNLSFEYDINDVQMRCHVPLQYHLTTTLAWNDNNVPTARCEIDCANSLGTPGCECKDDYATDGMMKLTMGQYATGPNLIVWQSLDPAVNPMAVIHEDYEYIVYFDAFKWGTTDLKVHLYYGNIPDNESEDEDVNTIVVSTPTVDWFWQTFSIGFKAITPGAPYIGQPIGIRFCQTGSGWYWIDRIRVKFRPLLKAFDPTPANGAEDVARSPLLKWWSGTSAQDTNEHEVYFGTDFDDVNSADTSDTTGIYRGVRDVNSYQVPETLDLAKVCYWRVDEINLPTRWKGDVWTFTVTGYATNPNPANGAEDVSHEVVLSWTGGTAATAHAVYLGTDAAAVESADSTDTTGIYRGLAPGSPGTSYDPPGTLMLGETYYWRIDAISAVTLKGHIWSFTVAPFNLVDDFESYSNHTTMQAAWNDYWYGPSHQNHGHVYQNTDANFSRDGNSMKFTYENATAHKGTYYGSWATGLVSKIPVGNDWTAGGVKGLVLYFYGGVANAKSAYDQMYVRLEDGSAHAGVVRLPDMNDVAEASWHEWNIDLADPAFSTVVKTNVTSIRIGFGGTDGGGGNKAGGTGTMYFDDIQLWPSRCRPEVAGPYDFANDDCITDTHELRVMADDWCARGQWAVPQPPADNGVVRYQMNEGSGNLIHNTGTLGSSYDITRGNSYLWDAGGMWTGSLGADPCNNPLWVNDPCRGWCLWFDGEVGLGRPEEPTTYLGGDYLLIPPLNLNSNHVSITAWIKPDPFWTGKAWEQKYNYTGLVHQRAMPQWNIDGNTLAAGLSYGGGRGSTYNGKVAYVWNDNDSGTWGFDTGMLIDDFKWNFLAVTIEPTKATVYKVNELRVMTSATNTLAHTPEELDSYTLIAGDNGYYQRFFRGRMSDVRIYNRTLTINEIIGLGGASSTTYVPLVSDADLVVGNKNPTYPNVDDQIDFFDYAKLADAWLDTYLWP